MVVNRNYNRNTSMNPIGSQRYNQSSGKESMGGAFQKTTPPVDPRDIRPEQVKWDSLADDTGRMKGQFETTDEFNQGAMIRLRDEALRNPGTDSPWRKLMQGQLTQNASNAMSQAQSGVGRGLSQMAMRGGYNAGTAERMAQQGNVQGLLAKQNVMGQGIGLDVQDEQNRLAGLSGLNQAEMGLAQYRSGLQDTNIDRALQERMQKRMHDVNSYNEQMRAWATMQTAKLTPSSGGGKK